MKVASMKLAQPLPSLGVPMSIRNLPGGRAASYQVSDELFRLACTLCINGDVHAQERPCICSTNLTSKKGSREPKKLW